MPALDEDAAAARDARLGAPRPATEPDAVRSAPNCGPRPAPSAGAARPACRRSGTRADREQPNTSPDGPRARSSRALVRRRPRRRIRSRPPRRRDRARPRPPSAAAACASSRRSREDVRAVPVDAHRVDGMRASADGRRCGGACHDSQRRREGDAWRTSARRGGRTTTGPGSCTAPWTPGPRVGGLQAYTDAFRTVRLERELLPGGRPRAPSRGGRERLPRGGP